LPSSEERTNLLNACYLYAFNDQEHDVESDRNFFTPPLLRQDVMDPEFNEGDDENNQETEKQEDKDEGQKRYMLVESIKLIQRNELGRQGSNRFKHNYEQNKKLKQHLQNTSLDKDDFVSSLQKGFRAMLGRERVKEMRESEFEFLGMKRVTSAEDLFEEQLRRENRSQRKLLQKE